MKQLLQLAVLATGAACLLHSCAIPSLSAGKSRYIGEPSWTDPIGMQVSLETKIKEVSKSSYFTAGIGYSMQGSSYEEGPLSGKVTAQYLVAPLLYYCQNKSGLYIEGGLQPAVLLSAKDKYKYSGTGGEGGMEMTNDYKDAMKTFNLGLPVGAGYRLKNGFGIGIRSIIGLTKNHKEGNSRDLLILLRASLVLEDFMKKG